MDSRKLQLTAQRLVRQLESSETNDDEHYYAALRSQATAEHVETLLSEWEEREHSSFASTSRSASYPRGSLQDLRMRLESVRAQLQRVDILRPEEGEERRDEYDFLAPSIPLPPIILAPPTPTPLLSEMEMETPPPLALDGELADRSSSPTSTPSPTILLPPSPSSPPTSTLRSRPTASSQESTTSTPLMEHHLSLQSSLLTSLTSMSSQLKSNSLHLSSSLAKDRNVVENAQEVLGGNLSRMKKEGGRLGNYEKKSRGTTCAVIGVVGVVAVAWVGVFLLIKVT